MSKRSSKSCLRNSPFLAAEFVAGYSFRLPRHPVRHSRPTKVGEATVEALAMAGVFVINLLLI